MKKEEIVKLEIKMVTAGGATAYCLGGLLLFTYITEAILFSFSLGYVPEVVA